MLFLLCLSNRTQYYLTNGNREVLKCFEGISDILCAIKEQMPEAGAGRGGGEQDLL